MSFSGYSFQTVSVLERQFTIPRLTGLAAARTRLLTDIYGGSLPSEVGTLSSVTSPVAGLTGVASCQKITMSAYPSRPRVWTPTSPNGKLVILQQGHSWSYNSVNCGLVIQQLITAGFTVCGLVLPGGADDVTSGSSATHNASPPAVDTFSGPIAIAINTLIGGASHVYGMGLSGGGWTMTMAAASDTRIEKSYPIAGTLPRSMQFTGLGARDWEQTLPGFALDYMDLYILGATGAGGRRQKQILHTLDPTLGSLADYATGPDYAQRIADVTASLGGDYDLVWRVKNAHEWDTTIVAEEILTEIS